MPDVFILQNCGGVSQQPSYSWGNSSKFLQLAGEHLEGRRSCQYFSGKFSFQNHIIPVRKTLIFLITQCNVTCMIPQLEEKVQIWQSSPASSLNVWFSSASCWSDLILQALQFLGGETKGMNQWSSTLKRVRNVSICILYNVSIIWISLYYLSSLLIRWNDGTPEWLLSICGVCGWISAVEVDW